MSAVDTIVWPTPVVELDPSVLIRFTDKVELDIETGCWVWTASLNRGGYGQFALTCDRKHVTAKAHRFAYESFVGPVPEGHEICHHCDRRPCVRLDHLFTGTRLDNMRDASKKGRTATGDNGRRPTKLTRADVEAIRSIYAEGRTSQRALAARFGISQAHVRTILDRRQWR